jgi:glutamyl-tRNA synthetase
MSDVPEGMRIPPRGRYAPSPTGLTHLGNARTALAAWLSVRRQRGKFVWRLEDLDGPREIPGTAEAAIEDLHWLGLDWDEGPVEGGPFAPYRQSERFDHYERALRLLHDAGRLFPCRKSRRDLLEMASAPHGPEGLPPYPQAWRPRSLEEGWFDRYMAEDCSLRFLVDDRTVSFQDHVCGLVNENVATSTGDFVLKRRDGVYAYQLAVVVDDLEMGITEVVRGQDLLDSTGRQIQLIDALGANRPAYAHIPLVLNEDGEKMSKRDEALSLNVLRRDGVSPEQVAGYLGYSLGLLEQPKAVSAADLIPRFTWKRVPHEPWRIDPGLVETLRKIG